MFPFPWISSPALPPPILSSSIPASWTCSGCPLPPFLRFSLPEPLHLICSCLGLSRFPGRLLMRYLCCSEDRSPPRAAQWQKRARLREKARDIAEGGSRSSPRACKNAAGGRGPGEALTPRAPDPGCRSGPPADFLPSAAKKHRRLESKDRGAGVPIPRVGPLVNGGRKEKGVGERRGEGKTCFPTDSGASGRLGRSGEPLRGEACRRVGEGRAEGAPRVRGGGAGSAASAAVLGLQQAWGTCEAVRVRERVRRPRRQCLCVCEKARGERE